MNLFSISLREIQKTISEKIQQLSYIPRIQSPDSDDTVYSSCGIGTCTGSCSGACTTSCATNCNASLYNEYLDLFFDN